MTEWQRARTDAQKEQRREEILRAAAGLFATVDFDELSLNAIAREAGLAKSNLYRYFESREEIFLQLYLHDLRAWAEEARGELERFAGSGDSDGVAEALAGALVRHPRLTALKALLAGVLERNISSETLTEFKATLNADLAPLAEAIAATSPGLTRERAWEFLLYFSALVAGLWPMSQPTAALSEVLDRPEMAHMRVEFGRELTGALRALLRGMMGGTEDGAANGRKQMPARRADSPRTGSKKSKGE